MKTSTTLKQKLGYAILALSFVSSIIFGYISIKNGVPELVVNSTPTEITANLTWVDPTQGYLFVISLALFFSCMTFKIFHHRVATLIVFGLVTFVGAGAYAILLFGGEEGAKHAAFNNWLKDEVKTSLTYQEILVSHETTTYIPSDTGIRVAVSRPDIFNVAYVDNEGNTITIQYTKGSGLALVEDISVKEETNVNP